MSATTALLQYRAEMLRIHSLNMTSAAASGHPTTCMSAAEIMSVLFFDEMRYDPRNPDALANDEFVLSKGHAAPVLYAAYAEAGTIPVAELQELRNFDRPPRGAPHSRARAGGARRYRLAWSGARGRHRHGAGDQPRRRRPARVRAAR